MVAASHMTTARGGRQPLDDPRVGLSPRDAAATGRVGLLDVEDQIGTVGGRGDELSVALVAAQRPRAGSCR